MDDSQTGINEVLFDIGFSEGVFRRDGDMLKKMTESAAAINKSMRELESFTMCKKQAD